MNGLVLKTKSNSVEGRVVTVAVNAFGNVDSQNDISVSGSFTKTLNENFKRIKHFLNHDYNKLIGCPLEGKEEGGHLVMRSELADTQLANDVLQFYKLYQKNGLTLEHSIGVEAMQRDQQDRRKVLQWKMWEFSTLYNWGANSDTPLLGIKHDLRNAPEQVLKFAKSALEMDFSEAVLVKYDDLRKLVEGALGGEKAMIQCDCGNAFDYYEQEEHRLDKEILEEYNNTLYYMLMGEAERQAYQRRDEVRQEVAEVIANREKSVVSELVYVRCPYCGRKHYHNEIIMNKSIAVPVAEPSKDTTGTESKGISFSAIGSMLK